MPKKVLVILADQLSYKFVKSYGFNDWIHTPCIDHFLDSGVRFENSICTSPLCIPSRHSIYTGMGTRFHGTVCDERTLKCRTLFHALTSLGIRCCGVGKLDFRYDPDQYHGLVERPGIGMGAQDVFEGTNNYSSFIGETVTTLERSEDAQCKAIVRATLDCLTRPEPTVIFCGFVKPHESCDNNLWYDAPRKFFDLYDENLIPSRLRGYCANVSCLDHYVGMLLRMADGMKLLDDTLVIFSSDHGEMAGDHERWGKQCMFEEAIKVPMGIWHKGIVPGIDSEIRSPMDILPTAFSWLGLPAPKVDGFSLLERNGHKFIFCETFYGRFYDGKYRDWENNPLPIKDALKRFHRCLRFKRWKLVHDGEKFILLDLERSGDSEDMSRINKGIFHELSLMMEKYYPISQLAKPDLFA